MSDSQRDFPEPSRPFRRNNGGAKKRKFFRGNQGYNNHTRGQYNNTVQGYDNSGRGTPENFQAQDSGRGRGYQGRSYQGRGQSSYQRGFPRGRGRGLHWPPQSQNPYTEGDVGSHNIPAFPGVPGNFQTQYNTPPFPGAPVNQSVVLGAPVNSQTQPQAFNPNLQPEKELDYTPGPPAATGNSPAQAETISAPTHRHTTRWDTLTKMCKDKSAAINQEQGGASSQIPSQDSSKTAIGRHMPHTEIDERAGADGEAILWEAGDEIYNEVIIDKGTDRTPPDDHTEQYMTSVIEQMCLERTSSFRIKPHPQNLCEVATPPRELTKKVFRDEGEQNGFGQPVLKGNYTEFVVLAPVLNEAPKVTITSLAQEFLRFPEKCWRPNSPLQLHTEIPYCPKQLLWARMMLVSKDDKEMLLKADIFRGVLASLYHIPINSSLLAAFLTFWDIEGHTLLTTQGEIGYPLLTMYDSMGLPISGHLYEEFIPQFSAVSGIVKTLHSIYVKLWLQHAERNDLVTVQEWVGHLLGGDLSTTTETDLPKDFYADPADPLLTKLEFRVVELQGRRTARFANQEIFYRHKYSAEVYRAAFLVVWLCTYCLPINMGTYIRPEVFSAAVLLARGVRLAVGAASMAHLYFSLDHVCQSIIASPLSASECNLTLPAHFIMGWFSSYWNVIPAHAAINPQLTHFPPFITDSWRITSIEMSMHDAHRLFLDLSEDKKFLVSLSFLGKSFIRFPNSDTEIRLDDTREFSKGRRPIRITAIDMLVSASVGAVTHIRCQFFYNLVYCPHRFAQMHGCDQEVPDFLMQGRNQKFLLQFSTYLKGTRDETIEHLQRRHLAFYSPTGHQFYLQPLSRRTKKSFEYMKWCNFALSFLDDFDKVYSKQAASLPQRVETNVSLNSASNIPAIEYSRRNKKISIVLDGKKTPLMVDSGTSKRDALNELANNEQKASDEPSTAVMLKNSEAVGTAKDVLKEPANNKQKANDEPSTAAMFENSEAFRTAQNTETALVPQKATGKRSSPTASSQDQSTSIIDPANGPTTDKQGPEINESHTGSPPKKPCLNQSDNMANSEDILRDATVAKSNIDKIIQTYKDGVGDSFTRHPRPTKVKKLNKYKNRSPIVVPKSTDPWLHMVIGYMHQDFEHIKGLITVPVLDKSSLVFKITKNLESWRMLLKGHVIPEAASELMSELEDLKKNLTVDTEHVVPFSISALCGDEEHIQDHVTIGNNSSRSVKLGLDSLNDCGAALEKLIEQVKENKRRHLSKIKELDNALRLARSELSKEQEREAIIVKSHAQYNKMVSEASEAASNFEELLTAGKTCLESIRTSIQEAGSYGSSNLPAGLCLQLKFLESCQVERAE